MTLRHEQYVCLQAVEGSASAPDPPEQTFASAPAPAARVSKLAMAPSPRTYNKSDSLKNSSEALIISGL